MAISSRVYLDHLISRQSLRYTSDAHGGSPHRLPPSQRSDNTIRFDDIRQKDGWFDRLVKPDFQRATCAWDPQACVTFLSSVIRRRIIPSIILWRSNETGLVYVLDGAHRLSVLRAWMIDDWGDKAAEFYRKNENYDEIMVAAQAARSFVKERIGLFSDFESAQKEWNDIARTGGAPRQTMSDRQAEMAMFYSDIVLSSRTLHAQWEDGDYSAAEESFLAINRQGVPLDDLESLLIEHRNGSIGRVIMSIASAGATGHYWPNPAETDQFSAQLREKLAGFNARCYDLHELLFVPPFDGTITDVNVPFVVAPGHFRRHQHLVELLPLLTEGVAVGAERLPEILAKDANKGAQEVIINADAMLTCVERKLEHLGGQSNGSLSLSLVPLIYWYNRRGSFVRALLYGWVHWLLSGDEAEVKERKIALSAVRGDLEAALVQYKDELADIQHRGGAGLKSLAAIASAIQKLVQTLIDARSDTEEDRSAKIRAVFGMKTTTGSKNGTSRAFSKSNRAEINVRELLASAVKCQICGGIIDLKQGLQYDHKEKWSAGGLTIAENGRPTHPFCNLFRSRITNMRSGHETPQLPKLPDTSKDAPAFEQLKLFDAFPGE